MPKAAKSVKKKGKTRVHAPLLKDLQPPKTYKVIKDRVVRASVHRNELQAGETHEEFFSDKSSTLGGRRLVGDDDDPYDNHHVENEVEELAFEDDEEEIHYMDDDDDDDGDVSGTGDLVDVQGDYIVGGSGLTVAEEAIVSQFLKTDGAQMKSLADVIIEKIREKSAVPSSSSTKNFVDEVSIPPKVVEVFSAVGKMLQHYKSGKLPKALKMLPHLKHWEVLFPLSRLCISKFLNNCKAPSQSFTSRSKILLYSLGDPLVHSSR